MPLTLDGSGSSDVDGTIASYDWDFGDGNTGTGVSPTHTYATAATFTVTLTVTDDAGATHTANTTATINPADFRPQRPLPTSPSSVWNWGTPRLRFTVGDVRRFPRRSQMFTPSGSVSAARWI